MTEPLPIEWGPLIVQPQGECPKFSGHYELVGKVVPETPGFVGTINYILQAASPAMTYQPNVERYATLDVTPDKKLKVTIVVGAASRSTTKAVICKDSWLRLEQEGENTAEGNTVRFHNTTLLTENSDGNLVVHYVEDTKSSTLFGLLRSKHTDRYWLLFPRHKKLSD